MTFTRSALNSLNQPTAFVSEWTEYTPVWTAQGGGADVGNGTLEGWWRRVGDSIEVAVSLTWGSTTTAGSSESRWSIPSGFTIDQSKLPTLNRGLAWATGSSAATRSTGSCILRPGDVGEEIATNFDGASSTNPTQPFTWTTNNTHQFLIDFPVEEFDGFETPTVTRPIGRGLITSRFSPIGLYYLDGANNLVDQSGNGRTLTQGSAPVRRAGYVPGISSVNGGRFERNDSTFLIQSEISVVALARVTTASGGAIQTIAAYGADGETSGANTQWLLGISDQTVAYSVIYLSENGAGNNSQLVGADLLPLGEWVVVGFTRDSAGTGVTLYVNGIARDSATLTAPDGGGDAGNDLILQAFQDSSSSNPQDVQCVGIWDQELTAAQMLAIAQDVLGTRTGQVLLPSVTPATLSADQDDWNPSGLLATEFLRVDGGASARTITGIQAPPYQFKFNLVNVGSVNLVLANLDGSSAAANQFRIANGDFTIPPDGAATLWYDFDSTVWRIV